MLLDSTPSKHLNELSRENLHYPWVLHIDLTQCQFTKSTLDKDLPTLYPGFRKHRQHQNLKSHTSIFIFDIFCYLSQFIQFLTAPIEYKIVIQFNAPGFTTPSWHLNDLSTQISIGKHPLVVQSDLTLLVPIHKICNWQRLAHTISWISKTLSKHDIFRD
jgi:hypothetical protein